MHARYWGDRGELGRAGQIFVWCAGGSTCSHTDMRKDNKFYHYLQLKILDTGELKWFIHNLTQQVVELRIELNSSGSRSCIFSRMPATSYLAELRSTLRDRCQNMTTSSHFWKGSLSQGGLTLVNLKKKKTLVNKNFLRLVVLLPSLIYTTPGCLCHLYVGWEHVIESCPCWMIYREEKISIVHWTSWDENRVPSWDQSWVPSWNEGWVPSWDGVGYHRI